MIEQDLPVIVNETPDAPSGFDYCFWSKLLVAIVLFPLVAAIPFLFITNFVLKFLVAGTAIGCIIYAAIKIDQMPCFSGKIPPLFGRKAR